MKKLIILIGIIFSVAAPVSALEITAPTVPESAADVMPQEPETFAEGLWQLIRAVVAKVRPEIAEAAGICLGVAAAGLMISVLQPMTGRGKKIASIRHLKT